jgi:flagellar biosynthesis protein FlhB
MSDELEDKDSKTEDPTPKRLEESLEKGQVAQSKEVTSFIMLLTFALSLFYFIPFSANKIALSLKDIIEHSGSLNFTEQGFADIFKNAINKSLLYVVPLFLFLIIAIVMSSFMQIGQFIFAPDQIMPKPERISLKSGFGRLFSTKSLVEFLKGIFKVTLTGLIIYFVVMDDVKIMTLYPFMTDSLLIKEMFKVVKDILLSITVVMFVIASADLFYQKYEHFKNLKMSRKEVKDEHKQTDGNPEIKKKQRQQMMKLSRGRMLENVPKADVIITNPEHYSIALQYDPNTKRAPIIVAKGLDHLAMKIRKIADENDIPIIANPPLARALYLVDLETEIPLDHYEAVAEVISYVYKLKNKKLHN